MFSLNSRSTPTLPPILTMASIAIDPHIAVIHVHVGGNLVDDVLLDRSLKTNIITKYLRKRLGLPSPKPTRYVLQMTDQSLMKLIKVIRDLKSHIHGIP
jgi:hypothetical protein